MKTTEGRLNPHPRYYYAPIPQSATQTGVVHRRMRGRDSGGGGGGGDQWSEGKEGRKDEDDGGGVVRLIIMVVVIVVSILTIEWDHYGRMYGMVSAYVHYIGTRH